MWGIFQQHGVITFSVQVISCGLTGPIPTVMFLSYTHIKQSVKTSRILYCSKSTLIVQIDEAFYPQPLEKTVNVFENDSPVVSVYQYKCDFIILI